ncbi:hypothetical protein K7432_005181 [Basidiobolus ranarum]|uniref:PHD-type domain-containing protein n=1 Tax=Basidiobolus ranarum TaxID=34480 RepID=A0ABR2WWY5_9FUNG
MDITSTPPFTDAYSFSSSLSIENQENFREQTFFQNTFPITNTRERKMVKAEPVTSPFKTVKRIASFTLPRPKPLLKPALSSNNGSKYPVIPTPNNSRKRSLPQENKGYAREGQPSQGCKDPPAEKKNRVASSLEFALSSDVSDNSHMIDQHLNITHISMNKILPQRPTNRTPEVSSSNASPITVFSQTPSPNSERSKESCGAINGLRFTLMDAFKRIKMNYKPVTKKTLLNSRRVTIIESPRMIISRSSLVIGSGDNLFKRNRSSKSFQETFLITDDQHPPQYGISKFRVGRQHEKSHISHHKSKATFSSETSVVPFSCSRCRKKYKTSRGYKNHRCSRKADDIVDCICGRDRSDIGTMIFCDMCRNWLHLGCLGMSEDDLPEKYFCPKCASRAKAKTTNRASKKSMPMTTFTSYLPPSDLATEDLPFDDVHDMYTDPLQSSHTDLATDPFDSDGELPAFENVSAAALNAETGQLQSLLFENDDDMYMLFSDVPPYDGGDVLSSDVNGFISEPCLEYDDTYRQFISKPQTVYNRANQANSMYNFNSLVSRSSSLECDVFI